MEAVKLYIPKSFNELTQKQLLFVSRLYMLRYAEQEFLLKAFLYLSGLQLLKRKPERNGGRWFKARGRKKPFIIDTDLLATLTQSCKFLLSGGEVIPVKWIKGARARHFRLYDCTLDEYLMAENYFFAWVETKDERHLDNLISVLYRRPWHMWNAGKIQERARKFADVDAAVKNAVFMWYVGFRGFVAKRCPSLFKSGTGGTGGTNVRRYINGIVHLLTDGDITRKKELLKQPVWDALDEMEQRAYEAAEMERRMKAKK